MLINASAHPTYMASLIFPKIKVRYMLSFLPSTGTRIVSMGLESIKNYVCDTYERMPEHL
jgi:hypothetical protein